MSTAEADQVLAAQKASGKIMSVFQSRSFTSNTAECVFVLTAIGRRYDSCFRTVEKIVKSGVLGPITSAQIRFDVNFAGWATRNTDTDYRPGSGLMFGIGSHSIDQALQLFGPPSHITGFYRALRGIKSQVDDTYMIVLRYDHTHPDLQVIVSTEVVSVMPRQLRFFIRGREGSFLKIGEDPQEEQRTAGMKLDDERLGVEEEDRWGYLSTKTKVDEGQRLEKVLWGGDVWTGKIKSERGSGADYYRDLAKALRGTGPLLVNPKQSRDGLKIMELARESFDTGRTLEFEP
jgi:predicted dehydrogenase